MLLETFNLTLRFDLNFWSNSIGEKGQFDFTKIIFQWAFEAQVSDGSELLVMMAQYNQQYDQSGRLVQADKV